MSADESQGRDDPASVLDSLRWRDTLPWMLGGGVFIVFCWLLSPILTPFVLGAGLAYAGDPIVDRLQKWGLSRTAGVSLVFLLIALVTLASVMLLVPMLFEQLKVLLENIPVWLAWLQSKGIEKIGIELPEGTRLDASGFRQIVAEHWSKAGGVLREVWRQVSASGGALLVTMANLLLVPVVTFYLLRDWDDLVAWISRVIPPRSRQRIATLGRETDDVLGAFIRGQLTVMGALALYYWIALWVVGLELALLVGLIVGLISFVPYLGAIVGVLTAVIAMLIQTQELLPFVWLAVVFGIGQVLESNVLTPLLVGERIGLHPVAVIFAVMAGGQLFGFMGVMLALPVAAVLAVLLREAKREWLQSRFYQFGAPSDGDEALAPPGANAEQQTESR